MSVKALLLSLSIFPVPLIAITWVFDPSILTAIAQSILDMPPAPPPGLPAFETGGSLSDEQYVALYRQLTNNAFAYVNLFARSLTALLAVISISVPVAGIYAWFYKESLAKSLFSSVETGLKKELETLSEQISLEKTRISELESANAALSLYREQLDVNLSLPRQEQLSKAIKALPKDIRDIIFFNTREFVRESFRRANFAQIEAAKIDPAELLSEDNDELFQENFTVLENAEPIFEALIDADDINEDFQSRAYLSFILGYKTSQNPKNLDRAVELINKAIDIRDSTLGKTASEQQDRYYWYEFKRGIFRIGASRIPRSRRNFKKQIAEDIDVAYENPVSRKILYEIKQGKCYSRYFATYLTQEEFQLIQQWLMDNPKEPGT